MRRDSKPTETTTTNLATLSAIGASARSVARLLRARFLLLIRPRKISHSASPRPALEPKKTHTLTATARRPAIAAAAARPRRAAARAPLLAPRALLNFFGGGAKKAAPARRAPRPTVVPEPNFAIPATLAALAALSAATHHPTGAGLAGVLAAFLAVQATRVRFVFDDDALEVVVSGKAPGEEAGAATENAFVGGRNRWAYDSFVNWEFWWPGFPVLVYFKETQTKAEGQIHFFPIIFDGKVLYEVMRERCGPSVGSGGGRAARE